MSKTGEILTGLPTEGMFGSNLIDLEVMSEGTRIGEVEDVHLSPDGKVDAYVIAVGGGRNGATVKHVAVAQSALSLTRTADGKWKAETSIPLADFSKAAGVPYKSGFNAE